MPLHEPRRYVHYSRNKAGKTVQLRSFDGICGVMEKGNTIVLCGDNYQDVRAVIKLRQGEWVEAEMFAPRVIDAIPA